MDEHPRHDPSGHDTSGKDPAGKDPAAKDAAGKDPAGVTALAPRLLHTLLFAVVFWLLCWAVAITALVQLALRVFAATPSPELQRFGAGLGRYAAQLIAYLSFASEALPFPFSDWPDVPTGITRDDVADL